MNPTIARPALAALSAVALFGAAGVAQADTTYTYSYNFDDVAAGTLVNTLLPASLTVNPAVYDYAYDTLGNPVAGSLRWREDATAPAIAVVAGDDTFPAPSVPNLMGDGFSPVLLQIGPGLSYFNSVTFTLDNDPFGDTNAEALLLSLSGQTVGSVTTDQTVAGTTYTLTAPGKSARRILLPAGASYDNLVIVAAAAPEPGTLALLGGAIALMGGLTVVRRARRA